MAFEVRTLGRQHGEWQACTKELYEETLRTGLYAGWPNAPAAEVRSLVPATQLQQAVARVLKLTAEGNLTTNPFLAGFNVGINSAVAAIRAKGQQ